MVLHTHARGPTQFLTPNVGARLLAVFGLNITTSTWTSIVYQLAPHWDQADFWDTSSNTRATIRIPGVYLMLPTHSWASESIGYRRSRILLNGTTVISQEMRDDMGASIDVDATISKTLRLAKGDFVETQVFHTRGSDLALVTTQNYSMEFPLQKVG